MARFSADKPGTHIRFGPAGWDYPDWAGKVYPAPKPKGFDPLRYLSRYFQTIEINSTFYRPATAEVARGWAQRVGERDQFRFTAKLWRRFTHERDRIYRRIRIGHNAEVFLTDLHQYSPSASPDSISQERAPSQ